MRFDTGLKSWHQPLQKIFTPVFLIMLFSGNGLLAGLRMKRPSIYIDQWTEYICFGRGGSWGWVLGVRTPPP